MAGRRGRRGCGSGRVLRTSGRVGRGESEAAREGFSVGWRRRWRAGEVGGRLGNGKWEMGERGWWICAAGCVCFRRWRMDGTWERMRRALGEEVCVEAGRNGTASGAIMIVDSQSARAREKGARGYEAAKKMNANRRHVVVDRIGWVLALVVHAARIPARDGAKFFLAKLEGRFPCLQLIWADAGGGSPRCGLPVKWPV